MAIEVDPKIVDRVKKLLARTAENGCTQAEAAAAFDRASALMGEYAISFDDIKDDREVRDSFIDVVVVESSRRKFEFDLAACICRDHFFVQPCTVSSGGVKRQMFFGTPTHVESARWVFDALTLAFDRLWDEYRSSRESKGDGVRRADRKTFITGVWAGFDDKLTMEAEQRQHESCAADEILGRAIGGGIKSLGEPAPQKPTRGSSSGALALFTEKLEDAFTTAHPNLRSGGRIESGTGSRGALEAGKAAGRSLNLNRPLGGSGGHRGLPS